ncbi:MAG: sulfurtransferase [Ignavibacteriae bacterium]|nr:MAG: sulfurtransferase [Ignavibacteriota bacterium]
MKNKVFVLLLFIIVAISNVSCQNIDNEYNITVSDLKEAIKTDSNLVILDVRTSPELTGQQGKIEDVINIPLQELEKRISELEKYKDKNFAVICRSGNRSAYGTKILLKNGYKAKNVEGGMKAYNKLSN